MKRKSLMLVLALSLTFAAAPGCQVLDFFFAGGSGTVARDNSLLPAMKIAWPGVKKNITAGIEASSLDGPAKVDARTRAVSLGEALKAGDVAAVAIHWAMLKGHATAGVNASSSGPGVKASLHERIKKFDESVNKLR